MPLFNRTTRHILINIYKVAVHTICNQHLYTLRVDVNALRTTLCSNPPIEMWATAGLLNSHVALSAASGVNNIHLYECSTYNIAGTRNV